MAIKQLTVYVQNKKGSMAALTDVLAKNGVNIRALSIADTEEFGILRLIVNDNETASKILSEKEIGTREFFERIQKLLADEIHLLEQDFDLVGNRYERFRKIGVSALMKE